MSASEAVVEARARLAEAGQELRARPAADVIACLVGVLDAWSDPNGSWQRELAARLPAHTGFSVETARAGLALGLEHWKGSVLEGVVRREIGDASRLEAAGPAMISGFDHTACVLAGSIPMPTLQTLLLPLVLRSPVLAKPASRDDLTAHAVASSLAEIDPLLGRCVEVLGFDSSDEAASNALLESPCIVALGSDATLARLRARVRPHQRWVGYGHRLSVAIVGREVSAGDWAERIALDVALWDQSGCLSPAAIYAIGDKAHADAAADALGAALAAAQVRWPRGEVAAAAATAIRNERDEAQVRSAAGRDVRLLASGDGAWTVVREDTAAWRGTPLNRFIRIHPVSDAAACLSALAPLGPHLAAVALDGMGGERIDLARHVAALGSSRIVEAGRMQAPPFDWHHDGQPLLVPLARFSELETR